jgi:hypothetical protein
MTSFAVLYKFIRITFTCLPLRLLVFGVIGMYCFLSVGMLKPLILPVNLAIVWINNVEFTLLRSVKFINRQVKPFNEMSQWYSEEVLKCLDLETRNSSSFVMSGVGWIFLRKIILLISYKNWVKAVCRDVCAGLLYLWLYTECIDCLHTSTCKKSNGTGAIQSLSIS